MPIVNRFYQGDSPTGDYRFFQIAWIVEDLLASARKWVEVYGVGPFHVMPRRKTKALYRGAPIVLDAQMAVVQSGPVQLEFIQQFDNERSAYRDIYGVGASGIHHMCTVSENFDETVRHYERLGYPVAMEIREPMRLAYIDTHKDFGFMCEVVEKSPQFMASLAAIAKTCASWDGTDPIRLLTRDGYRVPEALELSTP